MTTTSVEPSTTTIHCRARKHGTLSAYNRHRCRCPDARAAANAHSRRMRAKWQHTSLRPPTVYEQHDVDDVAVTRACGGEVVPLTVQERTMAVRELAQAGLSTAQIAQRLHVTRRTVGRHRNTYGNMP